MNSNILSFFKNSKKKKAAIIKAVMKTSVLFKLLLWRNSHFSYLSHFKTKTSGVYEKKNAILFSNILFYSRDTPIFDIKISQMMTQPNFDQVWWKKASLWKYKIFLKKVFMED